MTDRLGPRAPATSVSRLLESLAAVAFLQSLVAAEGAEEIDLGIVVSRDISRGGRRMETAKHRRAEQQRHPCSLAVM